jgi:hypothetical protein
MPHYSRREFLKTGLAASALTLTGTLPLTAGRQTATDWVTLGKSGVKVTRLALGTGSLTASPNLCATPTTTAFASLKLPNRTRTCTECLASR